MADRACLGAAVCLMISAGLCGCAPGGPRMASAAQRIHDISSDACLPPERSSERRPLPALTAESTLEDYLRYAALNNPALEAAFNRWKAALEQIPQVTALPDPRFTYAYFIEEIETRVGPQRYRLALSQMFPWFGKLKLRGSIAAERAEAARQQYEAEKLRLFYKVKTAYYEYWYLGRAVEVVRTTLDLLKYLERVARARYRAAADGHSDVMRAQVEIGKLEDRLRSLLDLRGAVVARLNAALNRPAGYSLPWPKHMPEQHLSVDDEQVVALARRNNPELKALSYDSRSRRIAIDLAKKDYFPDITLAVQFTEVGRGPRVSGPGLKAPFAQRSAVRLAQRSGDLLDAYNIVHAFMSPDLPGDAGKDAWIVSVSMNLPIWLSKYRAGERQARAMYLASVKAKVQRENDLIARTRLALYNFHDAERKINLYRDTLIPKARQSLKATETAYRAGQVGFADLVDAVRVLLEFRLSYERAVADRAKYLAELEMLVGGQLPDRSAVVSEHAVIQQAAGQKGRVATAN